MIELTEEEFKGDLDKYTTRIENGEDFLIKNQVVKNISPLT